VDETNANKISFILQRHGVLEQKKERKRKRKRERDKDSREERVSERGRWRLNRKKPVH